LDITLLIWIWYFQKVKGWEMSRKLWLPRQKVMQSGVVKIMDLWEMFENVGEYRTTGQ
jgi:hypothetical protein